MKYYSLLLLLVPFLGASQTSIDNSKLIGSWEGAFIKNNAYQKIEIDFYEKQNSLFCLQVMDEWHPTFGEFEVPVNVDSTGLITFGTGYGKARLLLDANNLEINGHLEGFNPAIYLHLKKIPNRPAPYYTLEPVSIPSGSIQLNGHLHIPTTPNLKTAIIIVGGRGCYPDATKYNLYAKFLRKYGVAVLAYQKRGTGKSTGDCSLATIEDMAGDIISAKQFLEKHPMGFEKIGVLGISAGGWMMVKAEETTDLDFMISIVGPSTSVYDQQMQSMKYGAEFYKLSAEVKENLKAYTALMFSAKANEADFLKMKNLLSLAEDQGWKELLEDTDIPASQNEIAQLWVQRYSFDPKAVLSKYDRPFLGIYGERDWIVPPKENVALLEQYFSDRKNFLTTVVAHNAEHGMEMEAKTINLKKDHSYWHFYRISPEVRIAIVDFLRKHELIK